MIVIRCTHSQYEIKELVSYRTVPLLKNPSMGLFFPLQKLFHRFAFGRLRSCQVYTPVTRWNAERTVDGNGLCVSP